MIYKSRYLDIVLIIIVFYSLFFISHKFVEGKIPFWDFHITYCVSKTYFLENFPYGINAHGDCLHPNITLSANYSPATLEIIKYLGSVNIVTANFIWIFLEILSIFSVFYVLKKVFKFDYNWRNFLLICFSFGSIFFFSFISGNISFILYGLIAFGIFFLKKKLFHFYYLIILFISFFKFYYLSFLLLPFYLLRWKSLKSIIFYVIVFFLIQYYFYLRNPDLTLAFLDVIQGKYEDVLPIRFQTGTGLYSIIEKMPWIFLDVNEYESSFFSLKINLMLWFIISFTIIFSTFICLKKIKNKDNYFLYSISFGILAINLLIPRLVAYDLILTVPILFYILNQINFKVLTFDKFKSKFFFIFIFLILFDHHFPFLVIITFLTLFNYSEFYKKRLFSY